MSVTPIVYPLTVNCPTCFATEGNRCFDMRLNPRSFPRRMKSSHFARIIKARRKALDTARREV